MNDKINKLVKIKKYYPIAESSLILERKNHTVAIVLGILTITTDELDSEILDITDSFQIRPKVIHKNTKGYYIKNPRKYLSDEVVKEIEDKYKF